MEVYISKPVKYDIKTIAVKAVVRYPEDAEFIEEKLAAKIQRGVRDHKGAGIVQPAVGVGGRTADHIHIRGEEHLFVCQRPGVVQAGRTQLKQVAVVNTAKLFIICCFLYHVCILNNGICNYFRMEFSD